MKNISTLASSAILATAVAAGAAFTSFADTTYTPSDAGWGEALTVADGENDYSANFSLTVKDGRLALSNSSPAGIIILVR